MTDPTQNPGRDLHRGPAGDSQANATVPARRGSVPGRARGEVRHRRTVGWRSRDVVRAVALVACMYLVLQLIWFAHALFLVGFLGVLFAIAVSAGVDQLQRVRVPRGIGAPVVVLSFIGLLIGFGSWMAPTLRTQGAELRQKLPEAVDRIELWIERRNTGMLGMLLGNDSSIAPKPAAVESRPAAPRATTSAAPTSQETRAISLLRARLGSQLSGSSRYLFPFLTSTFAVVGGLLLIVFLSIYLAADPDLYRRGALAILPARQRPHAALVLDRIATVLRKWLITQLIAMASIAVVTTIALLIMDVKAPFVLGLLAGLFEFIPTLGPILSAIPGVGMAFLDSPEKALYVAFVYWGIQFLENHILIPLLMKGGMDLPPALTVLAQALLALVFGFLGLMVAVPMLATVMVVVQMLYVERLPTEGTWTYPVHFPDIEEPIEGALAAPR